MTGYTCAHLDQDKYVCVYKLNRVLKNLVINMLVIVKCMRTSKSLLKSTTKVFKKNTSALHYSIRPIKNHLILDMTHVNTINLDIYRIVTSDFRFIFFIYILLVCFFYRPRGSTQQNFEPTAAAKFPDGRLFLSSQTRVARPPPEPPNRAGSTKNASENSSYPLESR